MAQVVNRALWDQWRQRIVGQRRSGLSIVAFCQREGVSPVTFHVWKRKLGVATSARPASRRATASRPGDAVRAGTAVQLARPRRATVRQRQRPRRWPGVDVTRSAGFLQLPIRGVRSSPWIEVTLADGTLARIPQENLAALTTLLRVLRGDAFDASSGEAGHA